VLLALVEHGRPSPVGGRRPAVRRAAYGLMMGFCLSGVLMTFGLIGVALWSLLSGEFRPQG
jgi:hypothetical protein